MALLKILDIPYDYKEVNLGKNEHFNKDYLEVIWKDRRVVIALSLFKFTQKV